MIEVEIRGRLPDAQFESFRTLMQEKGELLETQDREMILLRGYPGYSKDPNARDTDIRLRATNGVCEVMVKHKTSDNNVARSEISLPLACTDLTVPKEVFKALGYSEGLWMHRKKEVYQYKGIEWSIVDVPEGLRYFEAEIEAHEGDDTEAIHKNLLEEAEKLGLSALNPEEMRDFIFELDAKVNKEITW
jgi:predicted adenylyl cyclase CyaB